MMKIIEKPKIGQPCNGCGICCKVEVCSNGAFVLGLVKTLGERYPGVCPALKFDGEKYNCDILMNPNKYINKTSYPAKIKQKYFALLIGAGRGCDELHPDDTDEEADKLDKMIDEMKEGFKDPEIAKKYNIAMRVIHGI